MIPPHEFRRVFRHWSGAAGALHEVTDCGGSDYELTGDPDDVCSSEYAALPIDGEWRYYPLVNGEPILQIGLYRCTSCGAVLEEDAVRDEDWRS